MRRIPLAVIVLALFVLPLAAPAAAAAAIAPGPVGGRAWNVPVIRLYDTTPGLYREGINIAIREWNASDVGVRFVRTNRRSNAHVVVGTARYIGNVSGRATLGMTRGAWIRLDTALIAVEHERRGNTILNLAGGAVPESIAFVMAHEMGHVLGLTHTRGCSLMLGENTRDTCDTVLPDAMWECRLIQTKDVLAAARRYGGRGVVRATRYCPLSATRAGKVGKITAASSTRTAATKLRWRPTTNTYGYVVARSAAGGTCPATPRAGAMRRDAQFNTFSDTWGASTPSIRGRYCYSVWSKNGRGMLTGVSRAFVDFTPPTTAPVTNLTAQASGSNVQLAWLSPSGTAQIRIYRYAADGTCVVPIGWYHVAQAFGNATTTSEISVPAGTWTYAAIRSIDPDDADDSSEGFTPWPSAPACASVTLA